MRKKRAILLCLIGAALTLIALLAYKSTTAEPSHGGHPLSHWVATLGKPHTGTDDGPDFDFYEARKAIDQIGSAALPFLSKWIQYKQPRWRTLFGLWILRTPLPFAKGLGNWALKPNSEQLAIGSYKALGFLGNRANPAFDDLYRILIDTNAPQTMSAAFAIARLGPDSLRPLLTVGSNALHPARIAAIRAIGMITNIGNGAELAVHAMTNWLANSNPYVQMVAAASLGDLKAAPQISIPPLISSLTNSPPRVRWSAVHALGQFGPQARSALPALTDALADPDPTFPILVLDTIQKIAAEAPTNTPSR